MSLDKLENKGFAFLNLDRLSNKRRQIIVVGSARGGTSLIAGALHHLGIFGGDKSNAPVFEDVRLSNAFEKKNSQAIKDTISEYNSKNDIWFWKRPGALNYLKEVEESVTEPLYIFIFKDIFAIANRNNISMKSDIASGLKRALDDYYKIVDFIQKTKQPVMLVSAEKALQNKKELVASLAEINSDLLSNPNKEAAIKFITPNPKQYLDLTRNTKSKGNLESIDKTKAKGWAKRLYDDSTINVQMFINDKLVKTFPANQIRQDLIDSKISKTGKHGFTVDISDIDFNKNDTIQFIAEDDVTAINNGDITLDETSRLSSLL